MKYQKNTLAFRQNVKKRMIFLLCVITLLTGLMTACQKNILTTEQASSIVKDANDQYMKMLCYFYLPGTEMSLDKTQTLPEDPDMWLVADDRFPNIKAIKDFLGTVVTNEFIEKHYPHTFYKDYLSPIAAEEKGVNYWDHTTVYCEYQGHLYAHQSPPTPPGSLTVTDWDNPTIVSQSAKKMVVTYPQLLPKPLQGGTTSYELYGNITYTVKKENDTWLLDDITETQSE